MERRIYRNNLYVADHDDREATPESGPDSPLSGDDIRMRTAPSNKKSKKGVNKRVITVPIGDMDGHKSKGEVYPPSDSWTWRKYGQKPIKGSPYPRGYYRCSSSKGCPARKQVERSRMDPTKIVITYASEHNHSLPTTKHHHHHSYKKNNSPPPDSPPPQKEDKKQQQQEQEQEEQQLEEQQEEENSTIFEWCDDPMLNTEFGWFNQYMGPSNVLHSTICTSSISTNSYNSEVEMSFSMKEEDESLFADLEELPEYSMVFRQNAMGAEQE